MPRAPKGCAKPGCRHKQPCPTHRPAWKPGSGHVPLTAEFRRNAAKLRKLSTHCGYRPVGKPTGHGCGRPWGVSGKMAVDHIIPRSRGGSDTLDNLQTLCTVCHDHKTKRER
jgi:5-methylcytosine-specific restriction enzyme A